MRLIFIFSFIFYHSIIFSQENYQIEIQGKVMDVALDQEYQIDIEGKRVPFQLIEKDTLTYIDTYFTFQYPKGFRISKTIIAEGVEQIALITAEGSGYMIQSYTQVDPSFFNEMMLNEVTKESISYGYTLDRKDYMRTLFSGQEVIITKAVLTYKDDFSYYEVASIGGKDNGIIIVSMISVEDFKERGEQIIDLMWNTLIVDLEE